ncbi:MAG TPA: 50S ribosomal protein L25 [Patescibacteria group bacterium]|nr:50S ribosomal protein L25 [Patescibacteria group bacterium]
MIYTLAAEARTSLGKRSKDVNKTGKIPAVIYGHGTAAQSISVARTEFVKTLKAAGYSSLVDMAVSGQAPVKVIIKEVQVDPLTTEPCHIDFYQVRMDETMTATIPLKFVGESPAVKTEGGTLVKSLDAIEVTCLPGDLPHEIEIDLGRLVTFDDAIAVRDLVMPKGVTAVSDGSLTIATVARPLTEEELKKMEETAPADVSAIKTEGEEKKAEEEAKKAEEAAIEGEPKK